MPGLNKVGAHSASLSAAAACPLAPSFFLHYNHGIVTLPYNIAMLLVDAAAIRLLARRRGFLVWCGAMFFAAFAAAALGAALGVGLENSFGAIRLWCYGLFLHAPILLIATAVVWRKKKPVAVGAVAIVLMLIATAAYSFLVEPYRLEVVRYRIASRKIDRPVRIVLVADLQTDRIGPYQREALRLAKRQGPDLLLLAGDYIHVPPEEQERLRRELNEFLRELDFAPPLGAFAVEGNVDPPGWREMFEDAGIMPVVATRSFDLDRLRLTCLSLSDSFRAKNNRPDLNAGKYHIVLGHSPDFALGNNGADLLLAGHTHGGQIQMPLVGPIIVNCRLPRAWSRGRTDLPGGGKLIVSRGIGMERGFAPRLRFLCRPELTVIDLAAEKTTSR